MPEYQPHFEVDKQGLRKILERRGKAFAILELVSNAWDENVTKVHIGLTPRGRSRYRLTVLDDAPAGFQDLRHAYVLFAESYKKGDPTKRGRFNLGEKLVVALCERASVTSTKGTIVFTPEGRQSDPLTKTERGTRFESIIPMTKDESAQAAVVIRSLIPPPDVDTFFNGELLTCPELLSSFEGQLPSEIADEEGYLRPTVRKTTIDVYEIRDDEPAMLFEAGIPVVETGDRYHVNINQKIPLNVDRTNVTPSFLRKVRTMVLDHMAERLEAEGATETWVNEALPYAKPEAVEAVVTKRFGDKRVIYDPSDPEANKIAVSEGYTVIPPRSFTKQAWENIKTAGAAKPAGQVTPSPKAFDPEGKPLKTLPEERWTEGIVRTVRFVEALAPKLIGRSVYVQIATDVGWSCGAAYGPRGVLYLNLGRLGYSWFDANPLDQLRLLIHEFSHERVADHLSREFYDECCRLGAKLTRLAISEPELFESRTKVSV